MAVGEIDLPKLIERFGSEDKCIAYLAELRWPNGVECPRCDSKKISRLHERKQYECSDCRYQFSVRVGSVLQDSKLPLRKWFLAVYVMGESRKGVSANQLSRMLGVSYKTAWFLCHRIRSAMHDDNPQPLRGVVEADETYLGGKGTGMGNHTMVMGAIERGGRLRVQAMPDRKHKTIRAFVDDAIHPDAEAIYTDWHPAYKGIGDHNTKHGAVNHGTGEYVRGDIHTNTVESAWSLFDRAVIGAYHKLSVKHLPAYLDEFQFRFNNRNNPYLFRDTIVALIEGDALTFDKLTKPQPH